MAMKLEFEISLDNTRDIVRLAGMLVIGLAIAQELRKPPAIRTWHGAVVDTVPYDFRAPTLERLRDSYWNPNNPDLFTPAVFGVGWAINIPILLRNASRLVQEGLAEVRERMGARF